MYMSLDDLRQKFATDQPFAIQFVKDAADVDINVDILDTTGTQVDVIMNEKNQVVGGKLYDDLNLLNTYIKVINKITVTDGAEGKARLYDYWHAPFYEPDFTIDTNTRTITVPTEFSRNGVGVVGDHLAEILFFKVPRFFDTIDLLDCTNTNIYWYNNGAKGDDLKYHVNPPFVTYAVGDILYFGWAINKDASLAAGTIEFFIEFEHVNTDGQVDFRLETQSAKITIKPTLVFDKDNVERDSYNDIIYSRTIYSPIINSLTAAPAQIISNLQEGTIDFDENGYAILSVEAISPDDSSLVYNWNWNGIMVDQPDGDLINNRERLSDTITYNIVNEKEIEFSDPEVNDFGTTYKTLKTNVPGSYQVYIGNENSDGGIRYVYSAMTIIDPVSKITMDNSHLPAVAYLGEDTAELTVQALGANGIVTYQWYKDDAPIDGAIAATYNPSIATNITDMQKRGYYYCKAINTKNNTMESVDSHKVFIEAVPTAIDANKLQLTRNNDVFTVTITDFPEDMHFKMYANLLIDIPGSTEVRSIKIPDADKISQGGVSSFSIANISDLQEGQKFDIFVYVVPVTQYGTTFERYAENQNGIAYTKVQLSDQIK